MDEDTLLLRALLLQDWDTFNRMTDEFQSRGKGTPVAIIGCAFAVAAPQYFGPGRTEEDVVQLVADVRANLAEGRELPAREAEALMFAALQMDVPGVADVIENIDVGVMAEIQAHLLFRIIQNEALTEELVDDLLEEAEELFHSEQDAMAREQGSADGDG